MTFTKEELELMEISLRGTLARRGGKDQDIEQLIEKVVEMKEHEKNNH